MSKYAVIPALGYYGDSTVVVGSYKTLDGAQKAATSGFAVYETSEAKGTKMLRGVLSMYQRGEDGVYRIPQG